DPQPRLLPERCSSAAGPRPLSQRALHLLSRERGKPALGPGFGRAFFTPVLCLFIMKAPLLYLAAAALLTASPALARHFAVTTVDTGLATATAVTHAGDDRLFVVAKEGYVWIYRNGTRQPAPFLDIRDRVL